MDKIVIKKQPEKKRKTNRHAVVVKDDLYLQLLAINMKTGVTIENLVNTLLEAAINLVEIEEELS